MAKLNNINLPINSTFVESLHELLKSAIKIGKIKCILFDADGCLYDAERFSHYALYFALCLYNKKILSEDIISDALVGVLVPDQLEIVVNLHKAHGIELKLPEDLNDFNDLRDKKQSELFKERNLQAIDGVMQVLEFAKSNGFSFAIVTSSRYQPMIEKITQTGLDKYFTEENTFHKVLARTAQADEDVTKYATKHGISLDLIDYAKTRDFLYAASKMGFAPEECIGIEDVAKGVNSIATAGMTPVSFIGAEDTKFELATCAIRNDINYYITERMI